MCRYHIPRAFLKPTKNLVVVFEEAGGIPHNITILTVNRDTICTFLRETTPPSVHQFERKDNQLRPIVDDLKVGARLECPPGKVMQRVEFASFGDPVGACGMYSQGKCHSPNSQKVVEEVTYTWIMCFLCVCARLFERHYKLVFFFSSIVWERVPALFHSRGKLTIKRSKILAQKHSRCWLPKHCVSPHPRERYR